MEAQCVFTAHGSDHRWLGPTHCFRQVTMWVTCNFFCLLAGSKMPVKPLGMLSMT